MKTLISFRILVTTMAVIAGIDVSSCASETAASFDDSLINVGGSGPDVYGWEFSTLSDIQVTSLGLYDYYHGDGLTGSHPIGIWDVSHPSQPLVSVIMPAGNIAPIIQDFRYVNISPVILVAGNDYVIAALYHTDDDTVDALNAPNWLLTMGAGLQFDGYRSGSFPTTDLSFPSYFFPGQEGVFGPNFTYNVVPEPSVPSLCVLGAGVLYFSRKIRPFRSRKGVGS